MREKERVILIQNFSGEMREKESDQRHSKERTSLIRKISRNVSATMCDVMMTLVSMKIRLKTQGLFDPYAVCACRCQTVYCASELCLSVDKLEKRQQIRKGTILVYSVYVMCILSRVENWEYLHPCTTADAC